MIDSTSATGPGSSFLSLPIDHRLTWIYRIIVAGLLAQVLLSWPLWWKTNDVVSYLPIFHFFDEGIVESYLVIFPIFLILTLLTIFFPNKKVFTKMLLVAGLILVIGNIHRLQVWFYFYGLLLFLFVWRKNIDSELLFRTIRLVIVGVYVWSGLHKFNIHFEEDVFPWILEPFGISLPSWMAYGAGGIELLIGLGLLFKPMRNLSVLGCFLFHGVILFSLGPLGHNWNIVVWPWNLVMPMLVFLLFFKTQHFFKKDTESSLFSFLPGAIVLILVWVVPAFNYFGFTPEQLSFKMYAGSHPEIVLYFGESDRNLVGEYPTIYGVLPNHSQPSYRLVLDNFVFAEWGTTLFLTKSTARKLGKQLCDKMDSPKEGGLLYFVNDDFIRMPCEELE